MGGFCLVGLFDCCWVYCLIGLDCLFGFGCVFGCLFYSVEGGWVGWVLGFGCFVLFVGWRFRLFCVGLVMWIVGWLLCVFLVFGYYEDVWLIVGCYLRVGCLIILYFCVLVVYYVVVDLVVLLLLIGCWWFLWWFVVVCLF